MIKILTNDGNNNLKERLQELMPNSKEVKILVAYCHFSGIKELHKTLKKALQRRQAFTGVYKNLSWTV
jgi:HKD family nuclease